MNGSTYANIYAPWNQWFLVNLTKSSAKTVSNMMYYYNSVVRFGIASYPWCLFPSFYWTKLPT